MLDTLKKLATQKKIKKLQKKSWKVSHRRIDRVMDDEDDTFHERYKVRLRVAARINHKADGENIYLEVESFSPMDQQVAVLLGLLFGKLSHCIHANSKAQCTVTCKGGQKNETS